MIYREFRQANGKTANMRKLSISILILHWLLALSGPTLAAWAPELVTNTLAVIYDENDELGTGDFSRVIAGIQNTPDVVVYRIALNEFNRDMVADATTARPARPLHLAFSGQGNIAVIYPDIGEPYRSVFSNIIEGIEDKTRTRVASYAIGTKQNAQDLAAELRRQNIRVVIALGRNGIKAAASLDRDIGVVAGGVLSVQEADMNGMSVFSLAPDPSLLFERLRVLSPSTRRIFVIYDPRQNAWLIRLAREAARNQGLELVAQEASDLKTAMRLYQENLADADPSRDALWLPQDSVTVEESSVLPLVLQEAWKRSLVVFSSSVSHVKRGALFSLYPNNVELGRNLADTALGRASSGGSATRAIAPLREVLVAVNVRTAGHLGLGIGARQLQAFDMVFPEQ